MEQNWVTACTQNGGFFASDAPATVTLLLDWNIILVGI